MLIKITDRCSMGCNHCLSDCTPNLCNMDFNTFIDSIEFHKKYCCFNGLLKPIIISGGEPTESDIFMNVIRYLIDSEYCKNISITITTNGLWISDNEWFVRDLKKYLPNCTLQVVVDDRYYPTHVNENSPTFNYDNVIICRDVMNIYPQGRALKNNLPFRAKAPKCFNIRAITKQKINSSLSDILCTMTLSNFFCTPHIDINGDIKLGESRLCPVCSSIYKTEREIINDIVNFQCHQCDFINDKLPEIYKNFVK